MMNESPNTVAKLSALLALALLYAIMSSVRVRTTSAYSGPAGNAPLAGERDGGSPSAPPGDQKGSGPDVAPAKMWGETADEAARKSAGCMDCHTGIEDMHNSAINLGCVDCHGGNADARLPAGATKESGDAG